VGFWGQDLAVAALAVLASMTVLFVVALFRKDNSIVDIAWGPGFVLIAGLTFFFWRGTTPREILVCALVAVWGVRLAVHVAFRNRGRGEDIRYAAWRRAWGRWFVPRSFLQVFLLQGFLMLVIALPVVLVNRPDAEAGLGALDALGAALWAAGFLFEAVGDHQLRVFKRDPANKGKIMDRGLWRLTRHPNYFGEALMWWGIIAIALAVPGGWRAVVSPLLITLLLLRVSGVTLLEKKYAGNPAYAEYIRRTSAFIPWFRRK
jgi:steroid 5-alpha reductase family enzyme